MTTNDNGPLYDRPGTSLLETLIEHDLPTLRRLELGALDFAGREMEYSWVALGNVGKVLRRFPQLREVVLAGANRHDDASGYDQQRIQPNPMCLALGDIDLPELRRFALRTPDLVASQLTAIANARWPKLERLELWFGAPGRGCDCTIDDACALLAAVPPTVTALGLMNATFTDALIEPLARSPVLRRLRTLDLSLGCLSDAGAALIRHHADAFAHLESLDLGRSYLTSAGCQRVDRVCASVRVEDQREPEDEEDRYVAIGE
jgi:hypothetical protein